jgi:hypothetical protein
MIKLIPTNDKELLDLLSGSIFDKPFDGAVGFVLYADEKPVGAARFIINKGNSVIKSIGIIPEERGKGYGDFLTRSIMDNLSRVGKKIYIDYFSPYFYQFGFGRRGERMVVASEKLVFPKKCGGKE